MTQYPTAILPTLISLPALISLLALSLPCLTAEQPFQKVIHNTDPNAKCLDGSSPAIYIHVGS